MFVGNHTVIGAAMAGSAIPGLSGKPLNSAGMKNCAPNLNAEGDPNKWLSDKGPPWKKLSDEKPKDEMTAYDKLLRA